MAAGPGDDRLACDRCSAPEGDLPAAESFRRRLSVLAATVAAPALLAFLTFPDPAAAQQAYGDGPLVLRPPAGAAAGSAPVAGQTITSGGNVIVNLNAIGGGAGRAGASPYGGSYGGAVQVRPSYVGSAPGNYYNRPPLPGEVPLRDEDPIVLRPPGPDGYRSTQTATRPVLRPPVERRELPRAASAEPAAPAATRTATRAATATRTTTATPAPAKPASDPAPSAPKQTATRQTPPQQTPPQQTLPRQADPAPAASTQTASRSSDTASSTGPELRSTVRNQPAPAADTTATAAARTGSDSSGAASTGTASTGTGSTGTGTAVATPTPAPRSAGTGTAPTAAGSDSTTTSTAAASGTDRPVTLPATSAPTREPPKVPEPPSSTTAAASAPKPAAQPSADTQQTARATAPDRTLPAVPAADADTVTIDFATGNAALDKAGEDKLAALASSMKSSDDRLQIKAYANAPDSGSSSSARRLSLSRALSVRSYLIDQGIRSTRIDVRALGDTGSGGLDRVDVSVSGRS